MFSDPFGLCDKISGSKAPCELIMAVFSEVSGTKTQAEANGIAHAIINRAQGGGGRFGYRNTGSLDADIVGQIHARNQVQGVGNGQWKKISNLFSGHAEPFNRIDSEKLTATIFGVESAYAHPSVDPTNGSTYWDHHPSTPGQGASQRFCAPTPTVTIGAASFAECTK